MKSLIVYSSKTGNTKKIAKAVYQILPEPKEIYPVEKAPAPDDFDFIGLGFWVNRGTADKKAQQYMNKIKNKQVGLFGTLGAYPDSDHAKKCLSRVKELITGNELLGIFLCQGRVDPQVIEQMAKIAPESHPMTDERKKRLKEAEKHPDEKDCHNAQAAFKDMLQLIKEI